ncbi:MAG: S1 RNA-binding domain-containing protein, partial [Acidimicrobiia bacterium]
PKGKVINTIQQETGADIAVSDDGVVGTVSIGSKDGFRVEEAQRRIELILDPPIPELGVEYTGRVVNVTKFGAFVNILPGRDGLLHISKIGGGKRIDKVEDVLNLGDEVVVVVDDIDQGGKLSLSLAGAEPAAGGDGEAGGESGGGAVHAPARGARDEVSFNETWDAQAADQFGDLGPADERGGRGGDRDDRGGRGGGRGGRGGRGRGPRRD